MDKLTLYINTKEMESIEVALKKGDQCLAQKKGLNQFGSQILLPMITEILKENSLEFKDLEGIEVEEGPGSFTGLRVGASVAEALGFALNIPVNKQVGKPINIRYT